MGKKQLKFNCIMNTLGKYFAVLCPNKEKKMITDRLLIITNAKHLHDQNQVWNKILTNNNCCQENYG